MSTYIDYFDLATEVLAHMRENPELLTQPWQQAATQLADRLERFVEGEPTLEKWIEERTQYGMILRFSPEDPSVREFTGLAPADIITALDKIGQEDPYKRVTRLYALRCECCDEIVSFSLNPVTTFTCLATGHLNEVEESALEVIYEIEED